jgi:lipoate-protein ligase A
VTWRRLGPSHVTAEDALARGLELLEAADAAPTLAWWLVDESTLVLGRGSRIDPDRTARTTAGVPVARRGSGGGPVLWGPDLLALDVFVPAGHALYSDDVVASYRWLGEAFASALVSLGLPARALTPKEARATNDPRLAELSCYAGRSPWEVVVDDRKVVGLSQIRRRQGILLQAGLARHVDATRLAHLLGLEASDTAALVTALAPWPSIPYDVPTLIAAVETALAALPAPA